MSSCALDKNGYSEHGISVAPEHEKVSAVTLCSINFADMQLEDWSSPYAWKIEKNGAVLKEGNTSYLRNYYSLNRRTCSLIFQPSADSRFSLGIDDPFNGFGSDFWSIEVDAENQYVKLGEVANNYVLKDNHTYEIALKTEALYSYLSVKDIDSLDNQLSVGPFINECHDFYGIRMLSGESPLFKQIRITAPLKPDLLVVGNSITFGIGTTMVNGLPKKNYGALVGNERGKSYLISGRGGCVIRDLVGTAEYKGRLDSEIKQLKPKYVLITIGTNGGNTYENLTELITEIQKIGAVPILNNIPCISVLRGDVWVDNERTENELIEKVRDDLGINGARLDIATSVEGDGKTTDLTLYNEEPAWGTRVRIHPNDAGHRAVFEQIKKDCPELFE